MDQILDLLMSESSNVHTVDRYNNITWDERQRDFFSKYEWHWCLTEVSKCLENSPVINPQLSARLFSFTQHTHEPKSCSALMLLSTLLVYGQGIKTQSIHHPKSNYPLTDNKPSGRHVMLEWMENKVWEKYERGGGEWVMRLPGCQTQKFHFLFFLKWHFSC